MKKLNPAVAVAIVVVALLALGFSLFRFFRPGDDASELSKELPPPRANSPTIAPPPSVHILSRDGGGKAASPEKSGP